MSRHIVEKSDLEQVTGLYKKGISIQKISRYTGYSELIVRNIIKGNLGKYTDVDPNANKKAYKDELKKINSYKPKRLSEKELEEMVLKLHDEGKTINEIVTITKALMVSEVKQILFDADRINNDEDDHLTKSISVNDVRSFANSIKPGDRITFRTNIYDRRSCDPEYKTIVVQKKYPNLVLASDTNTYSYTDLFIGLKTK